MSMKLKNGFVARNMGNSQIMVATGSANFSGMVRLNASAAFIVSCLGKETTREQIIAEMLEKYDAPEAVLAADVDKVLTSLRGIGAIDE